MNLLFVIAPGMRRVKIPIYRDVAISSSSGDGKSPSAEFTPAKAGVVLYPSSHPDGLRPRDQFG
jgi:hypothetical protein